MFILLLALLVLTRPDGGYAAPGMGYREYRLDGFSPWLRNHVTGNEYWGNIRAYLAEQGWICAKLGQKYASAADFFAARLSPIEGMQFFIVVSTGVALEPQHRAIRLTCCYGVEVLYLESSRNIKKISPAGVQNVNV